MSKKLLFPNQFKLIGWMLFIPSLAFTLLSTAGIQMPALNGKIFAIINSPFLGDTELFKLVETDLFPTLIGIGLVVGGILVSFSKLKVEDEYISQIRLSSLVWAVYVNYALLFLALIFIYGNPFFQVLLYNIFTVLVIFIIRFHYLLYRASKRSYNEQ